MINLEVDIVILCIFRGDEKRKRTIEGKEKKSRLEQQVKGYGEIRFVLSSRKLMKGSSSRQIETTVYVTRTGKKYHLDGCRYLKSRRSIKLADARRLYQACRVCKPPQ
ncbi:TPA: hypothetical protein EYO57_11155 [Candidatus Poribacteria bacterium]|nr:hypothetical protein [Candidatus Poribacteria bacterium]